MPDIVAKGFNGGHDFKTSLMVGFERGFRKIPKLYFRFLLCAFLQAGIQMDADIDDHCKEGVALSGMHAHIMQMVII